jgi:type IV pilus assembly protein PilY1
MTDYTSNSCTTYSSCLSLTLTTNSPQAGYFLNMNAGTGEKVVTSAAIAGGLVAFSTNRPIPAAAGSCSTALGEARGYYFNLFNASGAIGTQLSYGGTRSSIFIGGGLPPSPVIATTIVNGAPKTVIIGAAQKGGGASSGIRPQLVVPPINAKRTVVYQKSIVDNK